MKPVLHVRLWVLDTEHRARVRLVLGEENARRVLGVEEAPAEVNVIADDEVLAAAMKVGLGRLVAPAPGVAKPELRNDDEARALPAVGDRQPHEHVFGRGLAILDADVEVGVVVEHAEVEELGLALLLRRALRALTELLVGEGSCGYL